MVFENEYIYTILHVLYVVYIYFSLIQISIRALIAIIVCYIKKKQKKKRHIYIYTYICVRTRVKYVITRSNFSLFFLFTFFFNNSGRDITCFPNALFISGRDLIQSFESRHGRHGNSNGNYIRIREITIVDEIIKNKLYIYFDLCHII
jgi:hypothetical protein